MTENTPKPDRHAVELQQTLPIHAFNMRTTFIGDPEARRKHENIFFSTLASQLGVRSGKIFPDTILVEPARLSALTHSQFLVLRTELNPHRAVALAVTDFDGANTHVAALFLDKGVERSFQMKVGSYGELLSTIIVGYFQAKKIDEEAMSAYKETTPDKGTVQVAANPEPLGGLLTSDSILHVDPKMLEAPALARAESNMSTPTAASVGLKAPVTRTRITSVDITFVTALKEAIDQILGTWPSDIPYTLSVGEDNVLIHLHDSRYPKSTVLDLGLQVLNWPNNPTYQLTIPAASETHYRICDVPASRLSDDIKDVAEYVIVELRKQNHLHYDASTSHYPGIMLESYDINETGVRFNTTFAGGRVTTETLTYPEGYSLDRMRSFEKDATPELLLVYLAKAIRQVGDGASAKDILDHVFGNTIMKN